MGWTNSQESEEILKKSTSHIKGYFSSLRSFFSRAVVLVGFASFFFLVVFPCGHEGEIIIGGGRGGGEKNINYILEFNASGTCPVWVGGVKDIAEKSPSTHKKMKLFSTKKAFPSTIRATRKLFKMLQNSNRDAMNNG